ncbi:MAG: hypothetical protein EXS05_16475 [Planctomycetaceae bacterium]|nr:hypothetical protein [Planctomycetaceae bacterium]
MRRSILWACLLTNTFGTAFAKTPPAGLPPKSRGAVDKINAAYNAGQLEAVWRVLAPAIAAQKDETTAKFDEALAAKKLPPSRELLVQARLKLLLEGRTGVLPAPKLRERLLVLEALQSHVRDPLKELAEHPLMQADLPPCESMKHFDKRLAEIGRLRGKLRLADICARYARELAAKVPAPARAKLTERERDMVAQSANYLASPVADSDQKFMELDLETRLHRLRYGVAMLNEPNLTKEKFIAAASTRWDALALKEALATALSSAAKTGGNTTCGGTDDDATAAATVPIVFHRQGLNQPELPDEVARLEKEAGALAGPLADKSERFALGLEAWLRGRYGSGPDVWGLAKSSAALKQKDLLGQVFMPLELPNALATGDQRGQSPRYPNRRHQYIWAWEDHRLVTATLTDRISRKGSIDDTKNGAAPIGQDVSGLQGFENGQLAGIYGGLQIGGTIHDTKEMNSKVTVPSQDSRLVYRIVGFVEYAEALQHLDKFVEEATPAEFVVAEEVIRSQEAFGIQANLSRRLEQGSTLSERIDNPKDDYNRHGLEWMLALARVELGAMLAGFTSHAEPFLSLAPTIYRQEPIKTRPFGTAAFEEMLLDGLRTHYWSIVREDVIQNDFRTGVPESHLLTYGRRAIVARQFVRAVVKFKGGDEMLPAAQRKELEMWDQTFQKLQRMMVYCLSYKIGNMKKTDHTFVEWQRQTRWITSGRDHSPVAIRSILDAADPTLFACPCR